MSRAPVEHFERLIRESDDPWQYETSAYEQDKYRHTLDFLPAETGQTLEIGCSIGVFTEMLQPRCEHLVAVDFSPGSLKKAQRRLVGKGNVEFLCRTLPEQTPRGPFNTIVCADVLYYWTEELVREGLARFEKALAPGGTLIAVHWKGEDHRRELNGTDVHHILREESTLHAETEEENGDYLVDVWRAK